MSIRNVVTYHIVNGQEFVTVKVRAETEQAKLEMEIKRNMLAAEDMRDRQKEGIPSRGAR